MKRFLVPLALAALAVSALNAWAEPFPATMVWKPVTFRTTMTSTTSPTFASKHSGENTGIQFTDSTSFTINTAGASAGGADTSAALPLLDWSPGPWRGGTAVVADSVFAFVVVIAPRNGASISPGADSTYARLDVSMDGRNWTTTAATDNSPLGCAEIGTSNSHMFVYYASGDALPQVSGVAGLNIMFFPQVRIRIQGDAGSANTGEYVAKVGYFQNRVHNEGSE